MTLVGPLEANVLLTLYLDHIAPTPVFTRCNRLIVPQHSIRFVNEFDFVKGEELVTVGGGPAG